MNLQWYVCIDIQYKATNASVCFVISNLSRLGKEKQITIYSYTYIQILLDILLFKNFISVITSWSSILLSHFGDLTVFGQPLYPNKHIVQLVLKFKSIKIHGVQLHAENQVVQEDATIAKSGDWWWVKEGTQRVIDIEEMPASDASVPEVDNEVTTRRCH